MEEMLKECQQDIAVIQRKNKKLKDQPKSATRDALLLNWETILYELQNRVGQMKKYMEEGDKVSGE